MPVSLKKVKRKLLFENAESLLNISNEKIIDRDLANDGILFSNDEGIENELKLNLGDLEDSDENEFISNRRFGGRYEALIERYRGELGGSMSARYTRNVKWKVEYDGSFSARELTDKIECCGSLSAREFTDKYRLDSISNLPSSHTESLYNKNDARATSHGNGVTSTFHNTNEVTQSAHSTNGSNWKQNLLPDKCIFKHDTYAELCHDGDMFRDKVHMRDLDKYCTKDVVSLNLNAQGKVKPVAINENSDSVKRIIQMNKYRKSIQKTRTPKSRTREWIENNPDSVCDKLPTDLIDDFEPFSSANCDRKLVQTNILDLHSSSVIPKPQSTNVKNVDKPTPSSVIAKTGKSTAVSEVVERRNVKNLQSNSAYIPPQNGINRVSSSSPSTESPRLKGLIPNKEMLNSPRQSNCDINIILDKKSVKQATDSPRTDSRQTNCSQYENEFVGSHRSSPLRIEDLNSVDNRKLSTSDKKLDNGDLKVRSDSLKRSSKRQVEKIEKFECDTDKENWQCYDIVDVFSTDSTGRPSSTRSKKSSHYIQESPRSRNETKGEQVKDSSYQINSIKTNRRDCESQRNEVKKSLTDAFNGAESQGPSHGSGKKKSRLSSKEVGNNYVCVDLKNKTKNAPKNKNSTFKDIKRHTSKKFTSASSHLENSPISDNIMLSASSERIVVNKQLNKNGSKSTPYSESHLKLTSSSNNARHPRISPVSNKAIEYHSNNNTKYRSLIPGVPVAYTCSEISELDGSEFSSDVSLSNLERTVDNGVMQQESKETARAVSFDSCSITNSSAFTEDSASQQFIVSSAIDTSSSSTEAFTDDICYNFQPARNNLESGSPDCVHPSLSDQPFADLPHQPIQIDECLFDVSNNMRNSNFQNVEAEKQNNFTPSVKSPGIPGSDVHLEMSVNSSIPEQMAVNVFEMHVNNIDSKNGQTRSSDSFWGITDERVLKSEIVFSDNSCVNKTVPSFGERDLSPAKCCLNADSGLSSESESNANCKIINAVTVKEQNGTSVPVQSLDLVGSLPEDAKNSVNTVECHLHGDGCFSKSQSKCTNTDGHIESKLGNGLVKNGFDNKTKKQRVIAKLVSENYGKYSSIDSSTMDAILQMDNTGLQLLRDIYSSDSDAQKQMLQQATSKVQNNELTSLNDSLTLDERNNLKNILRLNLLRRYFMKWKRQSRQATLLERARLLYRRHMLSKGFNAFIWSVNSSKYREDILKQKFQTFQLSTTFFSWHNKTVTRRYNRMKKFFVCWKTRADEVERAQELQNRANSKILVQAFTLWKERFHTLLKEKKAMSHFRNVLLTYGWKMWQVFLGHALEKKRQQQQARSFYEKGVQVFVFHQFKVMYEKYRKARHHHRNNLLLKVFNMWKEENTNLIAERQKVELFCDNHWKLALQRQFFMTWKDNVWQNKAEKFADRCTLRKAFQVWHKEWLKKKDHQYRLQEALRHGICKWVLIVWRNNVQELQTRHTNAVICLERVLASQTLMKWHHITDRKISLRKTLKYIREEKEKRQLSYFMDLWKTKIQHKLDISKAKNHWSNKCARKAAVQWLKKCHKTKLKKLLQVSEPEREKNLLQVMFQKWVEAHQRVKDEKVEAGEVRDILQYSKLKLYFNKWKHDTEQQLKIKPLLERKQNHLLHMILINWNGLVQKKKQCKLSSEILQKSKMRSCFNAWRRHYSAHQIEDVVAKKTLDGLVTSCFQGWQNFIKRKHASKIFHDKNLVKKVFIYWKCKSRKQIQDRTVELVVKERNMTVMKFYFDLWFENVHCRLSQAENAISSFHQRRLYNKLTTAFNSWRRHLRVTLLSREFNKSSLITLQRKVLLQWNSVSKESMHEAVSNFSEQIGLEYLFDKDHVDSQYTTEQEYEASQSSSQSGFNDLTRYNNGMQLPDDIDVNYLHILPNGSSGTQLDSPRSSVMSVSSYGSPMRRLFSLDQQGSQERILSCEKAVNDLLHTSKSEEDARKEKLRIIVATVVSRLLHWPSSVVFDHWRDYVFCQKELRRLAEVIKENHKAVLLRLKFREWRDCYNAQQKAINHRNTVIKRKVLHILCRYAVTRNEKKKKAEFAEKHYALKLYENMFPLWREKAAEKHFKKRVVHLWSNVTMEELNLMPLEQSLQERLDKKSLRLCFYIWKYRYQQVMKIKSVYHNILQHNCLQEWHHVCQLQKERRQKSLDFRNRTVLSMAYKTWCRRRYQKKEVEVKQKNLSNTHLSSVLQEWHEWATASKCRKISAERLVHQKDRSELIKTFNVWKVELCKHQKAKQFYEKNIKIKMLSEWHEVAHHRKQLHDKMSEFRVGHLVQSVKISFNWWKKQYLDILRRRIDHEEFINQKANTIARMWLKKARKSRGKSYSDFLQNRMVKTFFAKWKLMYEKCLDREDLCDDLLVRKNKEIVRQYLETWKSEYTGVLLQKAYNGRLLYTVIVEWNEWIKGNRERMESGADVQRRHEGNCFKMYFNKWKTALSVKKNIEHHHSSKLLKNVFCAWKSLTHKKMELKRNSAFISHKINLRLARQSMHKMKDKFLYCESLTTTLHLVESEKNKATLTWALSKWYEKLQRIYAARYFIRLLAIRVIRRWRKFMVRNKAQRLYEQNRCEFAEHHHNQKLCKKVLTSWFTEVIVSRFIKVRHKRYAEKNAKRWKLYVDMSHTAVIQYEENLFARSFHKWRLEYIKIKAAKNIEENAKKLLLIQVFNSWRKHTADQKVLNTPVLSSTHSTSLLEQDESMNSTLTVLSRAPSTSSLHSYISSIPVLSPAPSVSSLCSNESSVFSRDLVYSRPKEMKNQSGQKSRHSSSSSSKPRSSTKSWKY